MVAATSDSTDCSVHMTKLMGSILNLEGDNPAAETPQPCYKHQTACQHDPRDGWGS